MSDDVRTWWEIPSIVHFCTVFSPVCQDLCPININEFELAVEDNSLLLTDMALRFMKIYGYYKSDTYDWWTKMKEILLEKCDEYNFEYPLDSVLNFDDLTPKKKVEALYIMCHIFFDVEIIEYKISNKPELWHKFNIKPLGYDLNNSVYWYFGSTRLYREDFENSLELSENSSVSNVSLHSSLTRPYPSGISGSGKWSTICDDDRDGWLSFVEDIKYSKSPMIKSLHNSVCNIIEKLPYIKRNKSHYKYLKYGKLCLRNDSVLTRSLRSTSANAADVNKLSIDSTEINKYSSQNVQDKKAKEDNLFSELDKPKNNTNLSVQTRSVLHSKNIYNDEKKIPVKRFYDGTTKLPFHNRIQLRSANIDVNDNNTSKKYENNFKYQPQVNLTRCDKTNNENFENFQITR